MQTRPYFYSETVLEQLSPNPTQCSAAVTHLDVFSSSANDNQERNSHFFLQTDAELYIVLDNYYQNGFFSYFNNNTEEKKKDLIHVESLLLHWRIKAMMPYNQHSKQCSKLFKC